MAKVTPFYVLVNECLQLFGILHHNLSIDESMVPYFGRHSCKQFIRGKPIRFGYKLWVLCSSSGMPYRVNLYEGKSTDQTNEPLGSRVVKNLIFKCISGSQHLYFDHFFTFYDLVKDLANMGFAATGTIRQNRLKGCPITPVDTMKKKERGAFDRLSAGNVEIVRWIDNNVVTFCSNAVGSEPVGTARRWTKGRYM